MCYTPQPKLHVRLPDSWYSECESDQFGLAVCFPVCAKHVHLFAIEFHITFAINRLLMKTSFYRYSLLIDFEI